MSATYEKECGTTICKSGNLLCMHRVDASDESFHSKTIMGYGMSENILKKQKKKRPCFRIQQNLTSYVIFFSEVGNR